MVAVRNPRRTDGRFVATVVVRPADAISDSVCWVATPTRGARVLTPSEAFDVELGQGLEVPIELEFDPSEPEAGVIFEIFSTGETPVQAPGNADARICQYPQLITHPAVTNRNSVECYRIMQYSACHNLRIACIM